MARKLKTYQTSVGFFDLAIAAPSMAAALRAWGSDTNLFQQGFAKETDDPAIVAATLAKPGVVLRRPVGSDGAFSEHAKLPKELPVDKVKERTAKPRATREPPAQKVDDKAAREAALAFERERKRRDRERREEETARERERKRRDRERRKEETAREKERKRREQAIAKAEAALAEAKRDHETKVEEMKETAPHSTDGRKRRTRAGKSTRRNWKPLCAGRATSNVAMSQDARRVDPSVIAGAKPAPFPGFVEPCHPTLRQAVPSGGGWLHEIKFDGYRTQAHLRSGRPAMYTRRGHDWTRRFQPIADALAKLPAADLILDGEAVVADSRGIPDFGLLRADLAASRRDRLLYYAFDLLYLDGFDLRRTPLAERKGMLSELLAGASERILFAEHLEGDGGEIRERACAMGLEGIVSKQQDAPYRSGRVESWIKVKCGKRDAFPIVAFVEKLGAKPRKIASFYIGRRDGDRLLYAGKVRGGFTEAEARDLRERLDPFIRKDTPLSEPVKKPKATWVEPVMEAEVAYSTMTEHQLLREAVFKGLREDREAPPARTPTGTPSRARGRRDRIAVPRENILQLLPDAVAPSKEELAGYWKKVWKRALAHLGRRPLKLVCHVRGTTFYHKGQLPPVPDAVHRLTIEKREGGEGTRLWVDDLAGLLGLVEIGAVELHAWNAHIDDIEHPDMLVFDLDPGEGIAWEFVIETALRLRRMLKDEGLEPWPKLTGGKGLHLMAPLAPTIDHDQARAYAKRIAQRLTATAPDRYTLSSAPEKRARRIFIDYLRNGRGTTAIGAWSPRARAGFPVAAPVSWRQAENGTRPDAFTMEKPPRR